jgi:hypothetical protein
MSGAIPPLPNMSSWLGAQLKHRDNFTFTLSLTVQQNPRYRIITDKLRVAQVVKKLFTVTEPEGLLPCLQNTAIGPCHEPAEPTTQHTSLRSFLILSSNVRVVV